MTEQELHAKRLEISHAIKIARQEKQISQAGLAEKTGLGIATIKRIEDGRFWINTKQLVIICEALDVKLHIKS